MEIAYRAINVTLNDLTSVANPEGHVQKFERPNEVVMAVFGISSGATGI